MSIDGGDARCAACGVEWIEPQPSDEELARAYSGAYGADGAKFRGPIESAVIAAGRRHAARIAASLPSGARVVDVGCGRGVIAGALAHAGCDVVGVERSAEALVGLDPRVTACVAPDLADADLDAGSFDAAVCWHVLEHVREPRRTLQAIHRLLKPDGKLFIEVPNVTSLQSRLFRRSWFHLDRPRHLVQFTPTALRRLLEDVGFDAADVGARFSAMQGPFGWTQSLLNALGRPHNGLYNSLHAGGGADVGGFVIGAVTTPWAISGAVAEAIADRGAVVSGVARKRHAGR